MTPGWEQASTLPVRANPAYRLLLAKDLPAAFLGAVMDLEVRTSGVLVADPGSGLPDKVVDRAGALLFSRFERPAPFSVAGTDDAPRQLAQLVLDGVLEIETGKGFISGPMAFEAFTEPERLPEPRGRLSRLSHDALAYVERLALTVPDRVAARLYCFHRVPLSPRWAHQFSGPDVVRRLLAGSRRWETAMCDWVDLSAVDPNGDWLHFGRNDDSLRLRSRHLPYKLYVSPGVEAIADALPAVVDVLARRGAVRFKVGSDAVGLLRPDKFVVYLPDADAVGAIAEDLHVALAGMSPHGVPFSAELAGDGLLSWGGDPGRDAGPVGSDPESWRLSVCRRLAQHVVAAQRAILERLTPSCYALARLSLDGVDTCRFAPAELETPHLRDPAGSPVR